MKVAILNDLPIFAGIGSGAEMSTEVMMKEGWHRGHIVVSFTNETMKDLTGFDVIVLKNITQFGDRIFRLKEPFVNWPSDYAFCKWRLFYRQGIVCQECAGLENWKQLFQNAMLNIFLSPLHRQAYEHVFPSMGENVCIPSPIEVERFKPQAGVPRQPGLVIGVNSLLPFKGINTVLSYASEHPEKHFIFVGAKADGTIRFPANSEYREFVPNTELPAMYSNAEYFVHLPETPQPFERTVAEAYLCGCKLIVNKLVGATSYDWWSAGREVVREKVGGAAIKIWEHLEGLE